MIESMGECSAVLTMNRLVQLVYHEHHSTRRLWVPNKLNEKKLKINKKKNREKLFYWFRFRYVKMIKGHPIGPANQRTSPKRFAYYLFYAHNLTHTKKEQNKTTKKTRERKETENEKSYHVPKVREQTGSIRECRATRRTDQIAPTIIHCGNSL